MTISLRFCLSYDPLKWDYIYFIINSVSITEGIVGTVIFNDVTYMCENVITHDYLILMKPRYSQTNMDIL